MRIDRLKDYPLDKPIGTVKDLLEILVRLEVIPVDVIYDALTDEAVSKAREHATTQG